MLLVRYFNAFLRFLVIGITCNVKLYSTGDCTGDKEKTEEGQECCTNLRIIDGRCEVCEVGYFGTSCAEKCEYPYFGLLCRDSCNCSRSECDYKLGCMRHERSTNRLSTASSVDTSVPETVTVTSSITSSIKPYTTTIKTEKATHQETDNTKDNKFVVALSVTVSSSALIVFAVVLSKLRGNNKGNVIYYVQNPENSTPQLSRNHFGVPFRNLETDIYLEIQEVEEMDEISNASCGTIPDIERENTETS